MFPCRCRCRPWRRGGGACDANVFLLCRATWRAALPSRTRRKITDIVFSIFWNERTPRSKCCVSDIRSVLTGNSDEMARGSIDRRIELTRAILRHALSSLILKKGYEAISITDICEAANVARSTFYAHFSSKDDLKRSGLEP